MRARLVLLAGQTTLLGIMVAFLVVPASALFLERYGAGALPYAYLAVAVAGIGVSVAMRRAQARFSLAGLGQGVLATYLVVVAGAWAVLELGGGPWVTFVLVVLFPLIIPVGFVIIGAQAGRLLHVRQLKSVLPRVFAGFPGGFAIGGVLAAVVVGPLGGPTRLLAIDVVVAAAFWAVVATTARRFPDELRATPTPPSQPSGGRPRLRQRRPDRLVVAVFGYQVLSAAATQLLDYQVWERAAARYPDASDLARFQGLFGALMNAVVIVFVVLAAGRLLARWGVGFGLAANPAAVAALTLVGTVVGYVSGSATTVFFVVVCTQQVVDIALTDGTTRTSVNATYQALPGADRLRAQTAVEAAGVPVALGLVGGFLILHDRLGLDVVVVEVVTLVAAAAWLVLALWAHREYGVGLRRLLATPPWAPTSLRIRDERQQAAVDRLLASSDPIDAEVARAALSETGQPWGIAAAPVRPTRHDDVSSALRIEARHVARVLAVLAELDHHPHALPLQSALHDEIVASGRQATEVLALVHGREPVARAVRALGSDAEQERGLALEMIEVTLGRGTARLALGLVDPVLDDDARRQALAEHAPPVPRSWGQHLLDLVEDPDEEWSDPWLRACALYAAPGSLGTAAEDLARRRTDDPDPVVAETARWALDALASDRREP